MKKLILVTFAILTSFIGNTSQVNAQQTTIQLNPVASYQTSASAGITAAQGRYNIEVSSNSLPSTIPGGGSFYIVWATIPDGRADNLGTITNGNTLRTNLNEAPRQIFITAEKERFPEFVQGPRVSQSAEINATTLPALTATPVPTARPTGPVGVGGGGGTPSDVPETGLGGSLIFYTVTSALTGIGGGGLLYTYLNKRKGTSIKAKK